MADEDIYDLIIVGAGPAGCAAAYTAAKAGLETIVVERGNFPGAKNMTGGRMYAHSLEALLPGFASEAPVERCVTRERVSLLTREDMVTMEYATPEAKNPADRSYTVLRAKFDQWLWSKAEEAGAQLVAGVRVDEPILRDGKVCGISAGGDELFAKVVILADGVNSILGEKLGMVKKISPHDCAVGLKEVLEFPPEIMRDRFCCHDRQGMAWLFAGSPTDGNLGGCFLYTNENSISLGLVFGLHGIENTNPSVTEMFENFKKHPGVAPLLDGGKRVEYSAHLVPEGGQRMLPQLVGDGVLIAGDAAGMCLNLGYTVRGMDLAITSGKIAAEAVIAASAKDDFSKESLAEYKKLLADSFVSKEMKMYAKLPEVLDNSRIFEVYPAMAAGICHDMFTINGNAESLKSTLWKHARNAGILNMAKDAFKFMGAL